MDFTSYQDFTHETAIYPQTLEELDEVTNEDMVQWIALSYCIGKLNGEAGELAELQFKALRDEACKITAERRELMLKEVGDVLYYLARICFHLDSDMGNVAYANMVKLRDRKARGVLQGAGDER